MEPILADFAQGDVSPEVASLVDAHVKRCDQCRTALRWRQLTAASIAHRISMAPPADMQARILQAISQRAVRSSVPAQPSWRLAPRPAFAMACTMLIAVAAGVYLHHAGNESGSMVAKGGSAENPLVPSPSQMPHVAASTPPRDIPPVHKLASAPGLLERKHPASVPPPPETVVAMNSRPTEPVTSANTPRAKTVIASNIVRETSLHSPAQPAPIVKAPMVVATNHENGIIPEPVTVAKAPDTIDTPSVAPTENHDTVAPVTAPSEPPVRVASAPPTATIHTAEYDPMSEVRAKAVVRSSEYRANSQRITEGHVTNASNSKIPEWQMISQKLEP